MAVRYSKSSRHSKRQRGATMIEYALMITLILLTGMASIRSVGETINVGFWTLKQITTTTGGCGGAGCGG